MKKLLILTAVMMLFVGAAGCRCCDWMYRGGLCGGFSGYTDACPPAVSCDPCAAAPAFTPGPAPYTPAGP